jgi:predicted transcriptional regulator YdeE
LPSINTSTTSEEPRLVNEPAFTVIGLATNTTNKEEMSGAGGQLRNLWRNFMAESDRRIPGDPDQSTIFCVYTNYQGDEKDGYKAVLGRSVAVTEPEIPHGLERIDIDSARYLVFHALDRNPESVRDAWSRIHAYFRDHADHARAFTADFDSYGPNGVDVYVAIR